MSKAVFTPENGGKSITPFQPNVENEIGGETTVEGLISLHNQFLVLAIEVMGRINDPSALINYWDATVEYVNSMQETIFALIEHDQSVFRAANS